MATNEQDELVIRLQMFAEHYVDAADHKDVNVMAYELKQMADYIAHHTKEAERRGEQRAFERIFAMSPKDQFGSWTQKMIADWFIELGHMERELSAPQQSTSPDGSAE